MRISLPAYRRPATACGRTSSAAKKTFPCWPRPRRGLSVIRIGESQDGQLLRLKRSTGCVPGAALESLTLPPDEQQNDHDDQRCQAEHHQGDHGRGQDAGICLHFRISVSVVIGKQDISHIHSVFHVIRQCDVHCVC